VPEIFARKKLIRGLSLMTRKGHSIREDASKRPTSPRSPYLVGYLRGKTSEGSQRKGGDGTIQARIYGKDTQGKNVTSILLFQSPKQKKSEKKTGAREMPPSKDPGIGTVASNTGT